MDWFKKIVFFLHNPRSFLVRDSAGKVIPDWKRRQHSKALQAKINSGEINLGDKPRCLKRQVKGRVSISKSDDK